MRWLMSTSCVCTALTIFPIIFFPFFFAFLVFIFVPFTRSTRQQKQITKKEITFIHFALGCSHTLYNIHIRCVLIAHTIPIRVYFKIKNKRSSSKKTRFYMAKTKKTMLQFSYKHRGNEREYLAKRWFYMAR